MKSDITFSTIELEDAFSEKAAEDYPLSIVQETGRVAVGSTQDIKINRNALLEAFLFCDVRSSGKVGMIHIFQNQEGKLSAVKVEPSKQAEYAEHTQVLRSRFGKELTVRQYFESEEDGQAYVVCTIPCGFSRRNTDADE